MQILIYQDYVHNHGVLFKSLTRHFGAGMVDFIDAQAIIAGGLTPAVDLFVMPGGADLYYVEKLNGAGNAAIRAWVEGGGTYLGICAGAYYACAHCDWAAHTAHKINGPRELNFFPGVARGPVSDWIEGGDAGKSLQAIAALHYDDGNYKTDGAVIYEGGPVFVDADENPQVRVLARYAALPGAPAAIIECQVGRGRAILSSAHLEISAVDLQARYYHHRNPSGPWQAAVAHNLLHDESADHAMWERLLNRCRLRPSAFRKTGSER